MESAMDRNSDYINILIDSLNKKIIILDRILEENEKQKNSVSGQKFDEILFDRTLTNKEKYIEELNQLDIGFETVYNRVQDILKEENGRQKYSSEILRMKELIGKITDKTLEIQRQEKANQELVYKRFSEQHSNIIQVKNVRKVTSDYYNNMNKVNYIDPQFMDQKK